MKPQRIQRSRKKGDRLPPGTICVSRGTAWGNPFRIGPDGTREEVLEKYRAWLLPYNHQTGAMSDFLLTKARIDEIKAQLKGKNLACWCKTSEACHGDLLLKIANEE